MACSTRWADERGDHLQLPDPDLDGRPIEVAVEATITHGTRVKRAPRAIVRTIGVASITTRWTLSASASTSSVRREQPPALVGRVTPLAR